LGTGELPQIKESKKDRLLKSNQCPECEKKIQKDFNLCPYCGYNLKGDSVSSYKKEKEVVKDVVKKPETAPVNQGKIYKELFKNKGYLITLAIIVIVAIVILVFTLRS
ncbi:unnamed protein product, partial [marine sediment metagenome]